MVPGERRRQSTVVEFATTNRHKDSVLSAPHDSRSESVPVRLTFLREREGMRMSSRLPIARAAASVAFLVQGAHRSRRYHTLKPYSPDTGGAASKAQGP